MQKPAYVQITKSCIKRYLLKIYCVSLTSSAAVLITCFAAGLHIAGTVRIHRIDLFGYSTCSFRYFKVIFFICSKALLKTVTAGSSFPSTAFTVNFWDMLSYAYVKNIKFIVSPTYILIRVGQYTSIKSKRRYFSYTDIDIKKFYTGKPIYCQNTKIIP